MWHSHPPSEQFGQTEREAIMHNAIFSLALLTMSVMAGSHVSRLK